MHSADRNRHSQRQRRGSDTYTPWRIIAVLPLSIFSQWYAKAITTSVVDCIERFVGISSGPPVAISDMAFFFFRWLAVIPIVKIVQSFGRFCWLLQKKICKLDNGVHTIGSTMIIIPHIHRRATYPCRKPFWYPYSPVQLAGFRFRVQPRTYSVKCKLALRCWSPLVRWVPMRVVELRTGFDSSVVIHLISRICQDVIDKSDRCFLTASVVYVLVSVQLNYSHSFSSFVFFFWLDDTKSNSEWS